MDGMVSTLDIQKLEVLSNGQLFLFFLIHEHIIWWLLITSFKLQADSVSIIIIRLSQKSLPSILLAQKRMLIEN